MEEIFGSIEGKLHVINNQGRISVIIYEDVSGKLIRCSIDDWLAQKAVYAHGQRVYIFGKITYDQYKKPTHIDIKEIEIL